MKKLMTACIILSACVGLNVFAQDHDGPGHDRDGWYHDRDARFQGDEWRGRLFEHVRSDLEFVQHNANWAAQRERRRLQRTKEELGDLQAKLANHRFDSNETNDVIDSLSKSANDTRLSPRDKEVLNDDLNRMRDFREHHDNWWNR